MDPKVSKNDLTGTENSITDPDLVDPEEVLPIVKTVVPNDLINQNTVSGNVPLFIRKLWKMVNDDNSEEIISWGLNDDGFIIHDQLKFVSHTLPKYFKHNHLSSFVRQLNLYDFHKVQNVEKEEFQFSHPCFVKDVPQLLPLIKRKPPTGRQKATPANNSEPSTEVQEVMNAVKDLRTKSDVISNELLKLRQENAALWGEMNSLRLKYNKQTKIINKLIHFLISYMQKHHNARKTSRTVSTSNANKYLKRGPKIMELDYRYKNNPHEFWTEFDNQIKSNEHGEQEVYTVVEPTESNMELESQARNNENMSQNITLSSAIEELLPGPNAFNQASDSPIDPTLPQFDYAASQPTSSKMSNSALQRAGGSKENLGYFIDNSQIELGTIKKLFKNLTPDEMANFYMLVNDNYKNQEEDVSLDTNPEPEMTENELIELAQMSPLNTIVHEQDLPMPLETNENVQDLVMPFETNENVQDLAMPFETNENEQDLAMPFETDENVQDLAMTFETDENMQDASMPFEINKTVENFTTPSEINKNALNLETDENAFSIHDELMNEYDLLNDVSVDQFFN